MSYGFTRDDLRSIAKESGNNGLLDIIDGDWITTEVIDKALSRLSDTHSSRIRLTLGVNREAYVTLKLPRTGGGYVLQKDNLIMDAIHRSFLHLYWLLKDIKPPEPKRTIVEGVICPHCGGKLEIHCSVKIG